MTVNTDEEELERIVKSTERVRDLGEVFTPSAIVNEMLDLLPAIAWEVHPPRTFLEPSCGDGNFLVEILARKLDRVTWRHRRGNLPAGATDEAAQFHALQALASIYAIDISKDNIVGGTPGHEVGARSRLLAVFAEWNASVLTKRLTERSLALRAATWIVEHNVIIGNAMPFDALGRPTQRDDIPLIEYEFQPADHTVAVCKTTLGAVLETCAAAAAETLELFGPPEPEHLWEGRVTGLGQVDRVSAPKLRGPARNGARSLR